MANDLEIAIQKMKNTDYVPDSDFTWFTSEMGHRLKRKGDIQFISTTLDDEDLQISILPKRQQLYLVAMLDYLCHLNGLPLLEQLEPYRADKLEALTFPDGVWLFTRATQDVERAKRIYNNSIEEFIQHNIVEYDIRNSV